VQESDHVSQAETIRTVARVRKLEFAPGSRWAYSNSNYVLLGEIVHKVSGSTLRDYLSARVFEPLALRMVLDPLGHASPRAVSYEARGSSFTPLRSGGEAVGDGGIQTSPGELVRWADNYRTGRVGGAALLGCSCTSWKISRDDREGSNPPGNHRGRREFYPRLRLHVRDVGLDRTRRLT
jgi:CubicO group peptidase (beta-lactamase class C family)